MAGDRRILLAASTHPGEEALIGKALRGLQPAPLLVVAPRHPERGAAVAAELEGRGWRTARRSLGADIGPEVDAYVADTLGELGLLYRLADVAVLGGAFVEGLAGHNPLEPARLGTAVITGPHHEAFAETYAELLDHAAVLIAKDAAELRRAATELLADPRLASGLGARARAFAEAGREALEPAWTRLGPLLPPP
jgi:3-deoxy-D-manno-octulosonic-acid transferase